MANTTVTQITRKSQVKQSNKFLWVIGSLIFGLFLGAIIIAATGGTFGMLFKEMFTGNFGNGLNILNLLGRLSWMIPIGLALAISFRSGVFNIGATGQMIASGLVAYFFAANVDMGRAGVIFSILFPMLTGAVVAYLVAKLKTKYGVHEVISSILLNWTIFYLLKFLTNPTNMPGYFPPGSNAMLPILEGNSLKMINGGDLVRGSNFSIGIFIVVPIAILMWWGFKKTTWGNKQEILGKNPTAAEYIGLNKDRMLVQSMVISGALAGLSGAIFYLGAGQSISSQGILTEIPGEGFQGITISLIAFNNPLGVMASSLFVGMVSGAGDAIGQNPEVNRYAVDLVLAISIFMTGVVNFFVQYRPHDKFLNWMAGPNGGSIVISEAASNAASKASKSKVANKQRLLTAEGLAEKDISELKEIAKLYKVAGSGWMNSQELIEAILHNQEVSKLIIEINYDTDKLASQDIDTLKTIAGMHEVNGRKWMNSQELVQEIIENAWLLEEIKNGSKFSLEILEKLDLPQLKSVARAHSVTGNRWMNSEELIQKIMANNGIIYNVFGPKPTIRTEKELAEMTREQLQALAKTLGVGGARMKNSNELIEGILITQGVKK